MPPSRTHIAILTREYPPEVYGGAGVHVEHLARHLSALVDVAVHCFGQARQDPLVAGAYLPWRALGSASPQSLALEAISVDLAMAAGVAGADLVHSHTWYANLGGHLAKLLYDIPHVVTTHSLEPLRPWKREQLAGGYAVSSFCERIALEGADAVIAVSAAMRDDVLRAYPPIDPQRVSVIHNGIDPQVYAPDPDTDVLRSYHVDPTRPMVVFLGRITRQKGIVHLLEAAPLIRADAQLVLLAGAPDTPELAREVAALVDEVARERGQVVWIDAMLSRREAIQFLSHASVFVCPSIYEPFGLVNIEAMACGAPVVATAVGGIPEVVVDGVTGLLVGLEPGDDALGSPRDPPAFARALAEAINRLLADPEFAQRMGEAGRARAQAHFSWDAIAAKTAALYARLSG